MAAQPKCFSLRAMTAHAGRTFSRITSASLCLAVALAALGNTGCWDLPPFGEQAADGGAHKDSGDIIEDDVPMTTCPDNRCLISGALTRNQHWTADNQYILRGVVLVGDGEHETQLTIDPGTRIFGERQTTGTLVVQRHAKLYAEGTAEAPIVFSSDRPADSRRRGDWGGVVINGNAPVNGCEDADPCEQYDEGGTGWYGGSRNGDDSGVLRYVRIEFAGKQLGPSSGHGGLSLRGVGAGTTVSRLHLHRNQNDGISVFGGTVDLTYVLSTGNAGAGLSWHDGWQGRAQYLVAQQYDDAGDTGLLASNHLKNHEASPISAPTLYNLTLIGVPTTDRGIGLMLEEGTGGNLRNAVVLGFATACLDIDDAATWRQVHLGALDIRDSIFHCDTPFMENNPDVDPEDASIADFFYGGANNHSTDPQLTSPFSELTPDFAPASGSPAIGGAVTPADSFFEGVDFIGGVDPEDDWTSAAWILEGLNPEDESANGTDTTPAENMLECTGGICIASGTFTSDMHFTADKQYILRGGVFIGNGDDATTLIIDPGTEIRGESATTGFLVIQRNATIQAVGTPTKPIVFTSDKPVGSRARGDWGGVILNGNAPINGCASSVCEAWGEGGTGWYGGTDPEDSSGALEYVRIEFAGKQLGPDNELNGLALQGVGAKTTLSHLHLHMNKDDAIEFFGGTAAIKYVLSTGTGDDNLDWTGGWRGRAQFFVAQQYFDAADNGIEADNNAGDNLVEPVSDPVIANFTLIGVPDMEMSDIGMLLREGTRGHLVNGVVIGFNDACLDIDHAATWQHADDGTLRLESVMLDCETDFKANYPETDPELASLDAFFGAGAANALGDPGLDDPFDRETPRFAPLPDSATARGAVFLEDDFFTPASFLGGVDPADDWVSKGMADGWIAILAL